MAIDIYSRKFCLFTLPTCSQLITAMRKEHYSCVCIDDDRLFMEIIKSAIRQIEYLDLKECFGNPMKALMQVDREKPDIIFIDIDLPEINGFQFVEALDYQPIVIYVTSHWEQEEEAMKKGADAFVVKPLKSVEQLSDILFNAINKRS